VSFNGVLLGISRETKPLGKPKRIWENNIGMKLPGSGIWVYGLDWAGSG
jgi:hypothetical protein